MNSKISKTFDFSCYTVSQRYDHPQIVPYTININMITASDDGKELNIAYSRLNFWIDDIMQNAVLIDQSHPNLSTWYDLDCKVLAIPFDPVDQIIGAILFCKLQAIVENRLLINQLSISSPIDDYIVYHHEDTDDLELFKGVAWWNDCLPNWITQHKKRKSGKVIKLERSPEWKDVGLDWDDSDNKEHIIVYTDFVKK